MFRLKDFRKSQRLYQAELAEILGSTQSAISRMELRPIELTYTQYQALYNKFGQEVVDSFRFEGDEPSPAEEQDGFDSDSMAVIKKQADIIASCVQKQAQLTERLLNVLENLANRNAEV